MKLLGALLRFIYSTAPDPEFAALLDQSRLNAADARASRERIEKRAGLEPVDDLAEGL